ncbi:MAG: 23S rRNA (pseudouridine(1915)-N(3))-methyltransferase RlmH [Eubacteriales bacterium]|nr:23S rRNA (pseudouridine(1915)-N(3))-methyltransferase RlmH [Eubacteriales bacterium]
MNVTILAVGKIKEKFLSDAIDEYSKRLGRYCRLEIIRVKDDPTPDNPTDKERDIVLKREGERLIEKIPKGAYIIPLCIEGKQKSSEEFAKIMSDIPSGGKSEVVFIIGSSMGLWDRIKDMADIKLSFSKMTFPHQLMCVILLEQLYRAFNISGGGKYHK